MYNEIAVNSRKLFIPAYYRVLLLNPFFRFYLRYKSLTVSANVLRSFSLTFTKGRITRRSPSLENKQADVKTPKIVKYWY